MPPKYSIKGKKKPISRPNISSRTLVRSVPEPVTKTPVELMMQRSDLASLGIKHKVTPEEITKYSPDQLYEIMYGGSVSYFMSPVFTKERQEETDYIRGLTREINVEESIYTCPNCGYNRIIVRPEQLSSGDESMTSKKRCVNCGHQWSDRG